VRGCGYHDVVLAGPEPADGAYQVNVSARCATCERLSKAFRPVSVDRPCVTCYGLNHAESCADSEAARNWVKKQVGAATGACSNISRRRPG